MKLNKIFTLAALATATFFAASCSEDFDYTAAPAPSGAQVYFSSEAPTKYVPTEDGSSFSIPLKRANTAGSLDVSLSASSTEGTIYTIPSTVSFSDGEEDANIVISYDATGIEYGRYDTLTIAISDPELTTPYGISELTIVAGVTAWVDYGTALYREDLVTGFFNAPNVTYEVAIEKNVINEGYYRLVNPYGQAYPYNEEGDYDPDAVCYMTINATDPDWVYVEDCETAMDWGYGLFSMQSKVYYNLLNDVDLDVIKANRPEWFGTLKDGIITMPINSMIVSMADYGDNEANTSGLFAIALPGYTMADYSVEVSYTGVFTDAGNNVFAVGNLKLGEDAKNVKAIVMSADDDAAAVADAIAAGDLEAYDVTAGRIEVPIEDGLSGKLQLIAVVLNDGEVKGLANAAFEYFGGGVSPWKSLGTGMFFEDFVLSVFGYDPDPYVVEIEENTETPGLYRLLNAYAVVAAEFGMPGGNENIEVHAEDPNGVYVLPQRLGMDFGYGDMSIATIGGANVAEVGFDVVKAQAPEILGTLEDGVITFPSFSGVGKDEEGNDVELIYQGILYMGSGTYYGGMNGSFEIYLPEYFQSRANEKAKMETLKKAARFERSLKAGKKITVTKPFFSKKLLKTVKKPEVIKL